MRARLVLVSIIMSFIRPHRAVFLCPFARNGKSWYDACEVIPMKTLYISDMDGTLLDNQSRLSARSRDLLNEMLRGGLLFTVATARSPMSALPRLEGLALTAPLVLMNGAILHDPQSGKPLHIATFTRELALYCIDTLESQGFCPLLYTHNARGEQRIYYRQLMPGPQSEHVGGRLHENDPRFYQVPSFDAPLGEDCFYVTTMGEREALEPIAREIGKRGISYHLYYDVYTHGYFLECCPPGVDKGNALRRLRTLLAAERVVAFGDNYNDLALFAAADMALAVANAQSAARSAAHRTIGSNEEDGVVNFIYEEWTANRR